MNTFNTLPDNVKIQFANLASRMESENLYQDGELSYEEGQEILKDIEAEWANLENTHSVSVSSEDAEDYFWHTI